MSYLLAASIWSLWCCYQRLFELYWLIWWWTLMFVTPMIGYKIYIVERQIIGQYFPLWWYVMINIIPPYVDQSGWEPAISLWSSYVTRRLWTIFNFFSWLTYIYIYISSFSCQFMSIKELKTRNCRSTDSCCCYSLW